MIISFLVVIALSMVLAMRARAGHSQQSAKDFFVAHGQFGAVLLFFLSVGETYSVLTMLGFPGGVYSGGQDFIIWFFGFIMMAPTLLFFIGPWIWRAGRLYGAATIADFFGRHFESRSLEIFVAISCIILLIPIGTMQFVGIRLVLTHLMPGVVPALLTSLAAAVTLAYVLLAGLRASAFVAVLKDLLMLAAIVVVGVAALFLSQNGGANLPPASEILHATGGGESGDGAALAISTIILQAIGFLVIPQGWAVLFSARSADSIRQTQMVAPLYMVMFPMLVIVAQYARTHGIVPGRPDFVFLAVTEALLPSYLTGVIFATVTLAGLVILSGVCLAIAPLITRNMVPNLSNNRQMIWAKVVTGIYLVASVICAETSTRLMATINGLFHMGITQLFPGLLAALFWARVPAKAVIAGVLIGFFTVGGLMTSWSGASYFNVGILALVANLVGLWVVSHVSPRASSAQSVIRKVACNQNAARG